MRADRHIGDARIPDLGWIGIGTLVLIAVLGASGAFDDVTHYEY